MTRGQAGFTLLEVLIAALIAALALGVLFRSGLEGLSAVRDATAYERAMSIAQSHLAAATATLQPGEMMGRDGPYTWRVRTAAIATTAPAADLQHWVQHPGETPATLYGIDAAVAWRPARQINLRTERLGFASLTAPPP